MSETTPTKGMPCTISIGSDRYAARVVAILSPKRISVAYEKDADDTAKVWSQRKNGVWRPKGVGLREGGHRLTLGHAENYRDPSF